MVSELIKELRSFENECRTYFEKCYEELSKTETREGNKSLMTSSYLDNNLQYEYINKLSSKLQDESNRLKNKLVKLSNKIMVLVNKSLLNNEMDTRDLGLIFKKLKSALYLNEYKYYEPEVIHDEGRVFGITPGSQNENSYLHPYHAINLFQSSINSIISIIEINDDEDAFSFSNLDSTTFTDNLSKIKKDHAFVMMWMDKDNPELEDVKNTIAEVFNLFGIKAIRADEIEHNDEITRKIIHEIKTSEYLIADLTGARPNVYYEVGYAHALGKKVILIRKRSTELHFDLAGYNCREYKNQSDLKAILKKRLEEMTNKIIK